VRLAAAGGEALPPETVAAWHAAPGDAPLVNAYGPTEAVVTATLHRTTDGRCGAARVPIGRPIEGRTAHVLDARMRPASRSASPGELYVGGPVLARGYLGRPGLTAERFVPDPFSTLPGARLYRTGDRARWTDGGVLDFLGRVDAQVKVRGYRVEPGEIEAALRAHPTSATPPSSRCAMPARCASPPTWSHATARRSDADALRAHLAARLPAYMVPAAFVTCSTRFR
jgi:non-ribosomal peptide synthetase component F